MYVTKIILGLVCGGDHRVRDISAPSTLARSSNISLTSPMTVPWQNANALSFAFPSIWCSAANPATTKNRMTNSSFIRDGTKKIGLRRLDIFPAVQGHPPDSCRGSIEFPILLLTRPLRAVKQREIERVTQLLKGSSKVDSPASPAATSQLKTSNFPAAPQRLLNWLSDKLHVHF